MSRGAKHTPGPWHVHPYSSVVGCLVSAQPDKTKNTIIIAGTRSDGAEDPAGFRAECESNAHLIAAAPDLLAEIEKQVDWLDHIRPQITGKVSGSIVMGVDQSIKYMRAVLAKARGEA